MRKYFLGLLVLVAGCNVRPKPDDFAAEIQQLQTYFHIPAMAAIVTKGDQVIFENYNGLDSTTVIPMASLTKMFAGYLIMQTPNVLDSPMNRYVTNQDLPGSVKVKHVLSHTSQGEVGKHFYYSSRYSWLTNVVDDFEGKMSSGILEPYGLHNTFLIKDSSQLTGRKVAMPFFWEGETKPGFIDYGFSAASGITSTVRDIAKFGKLINRIPEGKYNYGYFKQEVGGETVLWAYGQYDCYSSLFIKVPSKDLILVMAANNNLMSDPARLIYGDVTTSLFALSFFKNFLNTSIDATKAKAFAETFLARYEPARAENAKVLFRDLLKSSDDLSTLHYLLFLKQIDFYNNQRDFTEFDPQIKAIAKKILSEDIDNPYANVYMGEFYEMKNSDSARLYYQRIADANNFSRFWYTSAAENYLKQHASTSGAGTASPPRE